MREVPNNVTFYYAREISPVLRFTLTYGMIFPLGLAGFVLSLRVWRRHVLLILYALTTVAALMSTIILARFRLVLVPVLIIYAAAGLVAFGDAVRARRGSDGATYLALWAGVALTQHFVLPIPALREQHAIAIHRPEYLLAADIYARQGRPDRALAEIERLEARAAARPSFAELAREAALYDGDYRTQWALQLASDGRLAEARHQVERVEATYQAYPELAYPLYNLGFLHLTLGDTVKARAYFERFLAREPTGARADRARRELAAPAG
jgi:tetratricopeptide (TPR) repeat protein